MNTRVVAAGIYARRPVLQPWVLIIRSRCRENWTEGDSRRRALPWQHAIFSTEAGLPLSRLGGGLKVCSTREMKYPKTCIQPGVRSNGKDTHFGKRSLLVGKAGRCVVTERFLKEAARGFLGKHCHDLLETPFGQSLITRTAMSHCP